MISLIYASFWLLTDQLHLLSSFHADFSAVSVSGVKIGSGRPYGRCAILYRSSFSPPPSYESLYPT